MRESTGKWLQPMLDEAENRLSTADVQELMRAASMPAEEAATPFANWLSKQELPEGARKRAIDWIRFGELLRERLGWHHYPQFPPEDSTTG